jgi:hypothetical protein
MSSDPNPPLLTNAGPRKPLRIRFHVHFAIVSNAKADGPN